MPRADDLLLEPLASFEAAREEWTALAERRGSIFSTWEWADEWWRVFGGGRELLLQACRDRDGRAVGILPLYLARRTPVLVARFVGHGPADDLGPVCAPADVPAVARALARARRASLGWRGVVLAERLAGEQGWRAALRARALRRESSPLLEAAGRTWDEWLGSRSANFRQQVRRRERRLAREHELSYRLVGPADDLDAHLEVFFALHEQRWGERSQAFAPDRRRFHRAFAHRARENGWLRLWFADLDGRPAAAWLGFRYAEVEWYYQAGRDMARPEDNVGFVLLAHTIREALSDGVRQYRFGLGDEPYKARFATEDPGLDTVLLGAAPAAAAASAAVALGRRVPPAARRRLLSRLR